MTNPPGPVPEFFAATDELTTIYRWARARYAAPWAVFWAVLLRVAATVEPTVQLPGLIGGRASLNLLCAFVAPSGGGKGISDKVARQAWPAPIEELPLGSGEGIAAAFKKPDKEGEEPRTRVLFNCPEIDTLTGLASRQGSVLLAQLKSMAMGEQIGQHNASKATSRVIGEHTYRACLSVGAQPGHTGVVFDDTTGGTPQRFIWALTIDPDMPAEPTAAPDPLDTRVPFWTPGIDGVVEIQYGPDEITQTVIGAHLARQRGESGALDGHAMLTRLKVAALLAILHKRSVVDETDWQLSRVAMAESDRTREWLLGEAKRMDREKIRGRALRQAAGEEFIDERRADVVRRRVLKVLASGELSWSDTRGRMGKKEYRELFDGVVSALSDEGVVSVLQTDRGRRLRLNDEFRGEPEFAPKNASSEGVNPEFRGEPKTPVPTVPTVPARDWQLQYLADNAGPDGWVRSGDLQAAGEPLGYTVAALQRAADRCDQIEKSGTSGRNAKLRIRPTYTQESA
ncbi:hypothetical protein ACLQ3K_16150 [Tsukamurella sp. DT100]|uniref:hypothetical protein n=1 Tax=Tsukamurella sp. DT100 TaxID=3393415 RepID=UPI003CEFDE67